MPSQKNILVLYTELAYYTVKCFSELASTFDVNIHILRQPVNKTAPFKFELNHPNIHYHNAQDYDMEKLLKLYSELKPQLLYCAGWTNKTYLKLCKLKHGECKTLLGFDTPWNGSLRQQAGAIYSKVFITPFFNYAFVPGNTQAVLAYKMGFLENQVIRGAYAADVDLYARTYSDNDRPKVILFVGRYAPEKWIDQLCCTFIKLKNLGDLAEWKLHCVGVGAYQIPFHESLVDLGFKQPDELVEEIKNAGIFILPSIFEPWGVVVHEMAAAGLPLILSDAVGSCEVFLKNGKNGLSFPAGNIQIMEDVIKKMCNLHPKTLKSMGTESRKLANAITPTIWAQTLHKLIA
jgi:glycosyltransferase involved in cell wall biosynthesis